MKFLCSSHALSEGTSRGFELDEVRLLITRREGRVYAYKNRCPHRGVALEWQPDQFRPQRQPDPVFQPTQHCS